MNHDGYYAGNHAGNPTEPTKLFNDFEEESKCKSLPQKKIYSKKSNKKMNISLFPQIK